MILAVCGCILNDVFELAVYYKLLLRRVENVIDTKNLEYLCTDDKVYNCYI